ncbi:MAG: hypothetical protein Q8859_10195 [Bacteroidota bacterium]|nr:hypothetical protein [Bacteroidota bacterium]
MKKTLILFVIMALFCQGKAENSNRGFLSKENIDQTIDALTAKYGKAQEAQIKRGVEHAAKLWLKEDGDAEAFNTFCIGNYFADPAVKDQVFAKVSEYLESLNGHFNKISLDLQKNLHLNTGPLLPIDEMFGAYNPVAHLQDDFYANKIAFIIALNFPYYTTEEKIDLGKTWSRKEWAYARLGDFFRSRVPAALNQKLSDVTTQAETYISQYNIYMGKLLDNKGTRLFPADMILLSHWNLRDELKSNYANKVNGMAKQKMIYQVMKRIINQDIPQQAINSNAYEWNPFTNKTWKEGQEVTLQSEPDSRYQQILNIFHAMKEIDAYEPDMNTYIARKFSGEMQIPQPEVEKLFDQLLTSPQVKQVAALIKKRLGRNLEPYDIWYDGFKSRSSISETKLDEMTKAKYPNPAAFEKDMPNLLMKLGFTPEKAQYIASKIEVDPARGSGHAWGAQMKGEKAHLRTSIPADGMNYKGYNIAVHEFGHNVEQTTSLYDVDYYMLNGVPNTAFTEALAFVFQKRDLELLGMPDTNPQKEDLETLDIFWSVYEVMGVSMVDMKTWKWLYANPDCTAAQLKEAVIGIAKEVWNKYYAPAFGKKDEPILAIYSHMIDTPLYLSAYSFGDIIHFQLEENFKGKSFANEVSRIYKLGQLTPDQWMMEAVGVPLTIQPLLKATDEALKRMK